MNAIQTAYINALLADAAYVSVQDGVNTDDMVKRLTPTQANYLAANFKVIPESVTSIAAAIISV